MSELKNIAMTHTFSLCQSSRLPALAALLATVLLAGCAQMQQQMQQPSYYSLPAASSTTDAIAQAEGSYANQTIRAPNQIQFDLRQPAPKNQSAAPVNNMGGTDAAGNFAAQARPVATQPTASSSPSAAPMKGAAAQGTATANATIQPYDASGAPSDLPPAELSSAQNVAPANVRTSSSIQETLIPEPQTFSGTLPCFHPEMKCSAQRITLSLAPNGRWRARAAYLDQNIQNGAVQADQGCWRGTLTNPPRIVLLNPKGDVRTELSLNTGNNLRLISLNGEIPNLTYTLSRQPDLDPISELDKKAAPNCP